LVLGIFLDAAFGNNQSLFVAPFVLLKMKNFPSLEAFWLKTKIRMKNCHVCSLLFECKVQIQQKHHGTFKNVVHVLYFGNTRTGNFFVSLFCSFFSFTFAK